MPEYFNRRVAIEIGQPGEKGTRFEGLDVDFRAEFKIASTPDKCSFTAYNLPDSIIAEAFRPDTVFRLLAGYEPSPRYLFEGRAIRDGVDVDRRNPDIPLTVSVRNEGRRYAYTTLSFAFNAPTRLSEIITRVVEEMGLARGEIVVSEDLDFPLGFTGFGRIRDVLDPLALSTDANWWVADGAFNWIPVAEPTGEEVVSLSYAAGSLLDITSNGSKYEILAMLTPSIRSGRRFVVEDGPSPGVFKARDVQVEGSSYASPYYTRASARRTGDFP